jgi:lathosterol oxidase
MLTFLLHILGYDIWFYISHILLHTRALWPYHKVHHKIIHPKFTDTYKGHHLESPFQSLGFFLPLAFMEFHLPSFVAALILVNIRGLMRHDARAVWLIGNHHLLHHRHFDSNYGEYWLDHLFGTSTDKRDKVIKGLIYV